MRENLKDGERVLVEHYYENGQLKYKANFKDRKYDGLYEYYFENGQLEYKRIYEDGKLIKSIYEDGILINE